MADSLLKSLRSGTGRMPEGYDSRNGFVPMAMAEEEAKRSGVSQWIQKLPADFPIDAWDGLNTKQQRSLSLKANLNGQEQWALLNLRLPLNTLASYTQDDQARQLRQNKLSLAASLGIQPNTSLAEATKALQNVLKPLYTNYMRSKGLLPLDADPKFLSAVSTLYDNIQQAVARKNGAKTAAPDDRTPDGYAPDGTPIYKVELKKGKKAEIPPAEKRPAYLAELANMTQLSSPDVMKANTEGETQKYLLEHANDPYAKKLLEGAQRLYYLDLIDSGEKPESLSGYYDMVATDLKNHEKDENKVFQVKRRSGHQVVYEDIRQKAILQGQSETAGAKLARAALEYYGVDYKMSGKSRKEGLDCSGFVSRAIADAFGKSVGSYNTKAKSIYKIAAQNSTYEWDAKDGTNVNTSKMQQGDLVFVSKGPNRRDIRPDAITHIMIYMGDGIVMDASSIDGKVILQDLQDYPRFAGSDYYISHVVRAFE